MPGMFRWPTGLNNILFIFHHLVLVKESTYWQLGLLPSGKSREPAPVGLLDEAVFGIEGNFIYWNQQSRFHAFA
jgi:hypothetical protein